MVRLHVVLFFLISTYNGMDFQPILFMPCLYVNLKMYISEVRSYMSIVDNTNEMTFW